MFLAQKSCGLDARERSSCGLLNAGPSGEPGKVIQRVELIGVHVDEHRGRAHARVPGVDGVAKPAQAEVILAGLEPRRQECRRDCRLAK
jgi:hypothetical protein